VAVGALVLVTAFVLTARSARLYGWLPRTSEREDEFAVRALQPASAG